jgi:hypothetical protein
MLTNVAKPTGTSGSAGAGASSAPTAGSYRLNADDSKLSPHVGHKVELTGTIEDEAASPRASSASSSAPNAPRFKVEDVKMIAASCSAQ